MLRLLTIGTAAMALAACDGPREQAGEKADNASGAVESEDSIKSGPAETMGERLEEQADAQRQAAEQKAEALDQQAEKVRGK
jgi:hypothetical protein